MNRLNVKKIITLGSLLIILSLGAMTSAFAHKQAGDSLGTIHFETSANPSAQIYFINAVKLLHSFEYDEARLLFQQAEKVDPSFALAYWGEAMTYNHPLWVEQDTQAGKTALIKLAPNMSERIAKAKTAKEKGFMNAINLLYGDGSKKNRDQAYADAMRELYRQYPNDDEIASFYALAILGATEGERDHRAYIQAAAIVEEVTAHNPNHPGAMHYAIHSYDDPSHAPLGLRAARVYSKKAADSSHALHMPSHIFLAMGMWNDVIDANFAAWNAGKKHNPSDNPAAYTVHDLHALQWLSYGYLQKQEYQKAYTLVKIMEHIANTTQSTKAKWYYALTRDAYIAESRDWKVDLTKIDMQGIELSARASDLYIDALIALNSKQDTKQAEKILQTLNGLILNSHVTQGIIDDYFSANTKDSIITAKIIKLQLQALIQLQKGNQKDALETLNQAIALEDKTSFGYGPPVPVQPSYELLANTLLAKNEYLAAHHYFMMSLKRAPHRFLAEQGKIQTEAKLKAVGISSYEKENKYYHKLM